MKFKTVLNTGITNGSSNGAKNYEEIFLDETNKFNKFRIYIHNESYISQSYARLSKWSDKDGWITIHSKNPEKDYKINISYRDKGTYSEDIFLPIINDLKKLAENF
jgi:hypothetical protein